MLSRRNVVIVVTLLAIVFVVVLLRLPSEEDDSSPSVAKIMIALPLDREIGQDMLDAARLALEEVGGEVNDATVEIITFNTSVRQNDRNPELDAADMILNDDTVVAYIGATSTDRAQEVIPLLNDVQLAVISPSATWPGLTKPGFGAGEPGIYYQSGERTFFRTVPSDDVQGLVALRWMRQQEFEQIFIAHMDSVYSAGLAGIVESNALDLEVEVVGKSVFTFEPLSADDLQGLLDQIIAAQPDVVYLPIISGGSGWQVVEAIRAQAPDLPVLGGDGLVSEDIPPDTTGLERIFATTTFTDYLATDSATEFVENYQRAYDKVPPSFAFTTYDAMKAVLLALENASPISRPTVLTALMNLTPVDGALGQWTFDDNGDISVATIAIMQLVDGEWEIEALVDEG